MLSDLPPIADVGEQCRHFRLVPGADYPVIMVSM
jgi:hypothetical protein